MIDRQIEETANMAMSDTGKRVTRRTTSILVLAACLLLAMALVPRQALAQDGSITILSRQQGDHTYTAYQVFCADVSDTSSSRHISWASPELRDDVLGVLDTAGYGTWLDEAHPGPKQHDLAQNAAEFIGECVEQTDGTTRDHQSAQSLLNALARSLDADERIKAVSFVAGREAMVAQGHWIVFSSRDQQEGIAYSAPLWVSVGDQPITVNEKADIPTLEKQVRDPADKAWKKIATIHTGEQCTFRIVGTLPATISSFEHFPYCVTDQLPMGSRIVLGKGDAVQNAVTVRVGDKEVKPDGTHLSISYKKRVLTVSFADLADEYWASYEVGPGKNVVISYVASLTQRASSAQTGNINSATLSYPCDPLRQTLAQTGQTCANLLTHTLTLRKLDGQTGSPLAGARFAIRRKEAGPKADKPAFVQADGSVGSKPHGFATGRDGTVTICGIGQGSYEIIEQVAPKGYRSGADPIPLDITAAVDARTLRRSELTARTSSEVATVEAVDAKEGSIVLAITNEPDTQPPSKNPVEQLAQTGVGPLVASLAGAGLAFIALSLAVERRR